MKNRLVAALAWLWLASVATCTGSLAGESVTSRSTQQHRGYRVGAECRDGWLSNSTGSGTCSHHGGVYRWTYRDTRGGIWQPAEQTRLHDTFALIRGYSETPAKLGVLGFIVWTIANDSRKRYR